MARNRIFLSNIGKPIIDPILKRSFEFQELLYPIDLLKSTNIGNQLERRKKSLITCWLCDGSSNVTCDCHDHPPGGKLKPCNMGLQFRERKRNGKPKN